MNFAIPFMMSSRSGPGLGAEEKRLYDILAATKQELRELQDRYQELSYRYDALQSSTQFREDGKRVFVRDGETVRDITGYTCVQFPGGTDTVTFYGPDSKFSVLASPADRIFIGDMLYAAGWVPVMGNYYNPDKVEVVETGSLRYGKMRCDGNWADIVLNAEACSAFWHRKQSPRVASVRKILDPKT